MASSCSTTERKEKLIGVAITDFSDEGFAALKWASDFLKRPTIYKLCIIQIKLEPHKDPCRGSTFKNWDEIEGGFKKDAGDRIIDKFQTLAQDFSQNICAKNYVGKNIQETLQFAVNDNKAEMDTLVIGAGSQAVQTQIELKLSGCSVVLVKIDPGKTLSLSPTASPAMEPQQGAAHPSAPPQPRQTQGGAHGGHGASLTRER